MDQPEGVPPVSKEEKTEAEETQHGHEGDGFGEDVDAKRTEMAKKEQNDKKQDAKDKKHKKHEKKKRHKKEKKKNKKERTKEKKKDKEKKDRRKTEKAKKSKSTKQDKKSRSPSKEEQAEEQEDANMASGRDAEAALGSQNVTEQGGNPAAAVSEEKEKSQTCGHNDHETVQVPSDAEEADAKEEKPKGRDKASDNGRKHKRRKEKAKKSKGSRQNKKSDSSSHVKEEKEKTIASIPDLCVDTNLEHKKDEVQIVDELVQVASDVEDLDGKE